VGVGPPVPFGNSSLLLGQVWRIATACWNPCQVIVSFISCPPIGNVVSIDEDPALGETDSTSDSDRAHDHRRAGEDVQKGHSWEPASNALVETAPVIEYTPANW
jgi:hypothetical protein